MNSAKKTEVPRAIFDIAHRVVRKIQTALTSDVPNRDTIETEPQTPNPAVHKETPGIAFIIRVPNEDSLQPHQTLNEVGWLVYIKRHCPNIPVPRVYDFSAEADPSTSFIAMEYIDAEPLSSAWRSYSESDKECVARKLAELVVCLGEQRFAVIGGMTPTEIAGPTVEGSKTFKGRKVFHDPAYYDIGPYASMEQYVLAAYDKEIHYHAHADPGMLDMELFENMTPADFVQELRNSRSVAETELTTKPRDEPFVLCHEDLQGRNILMQATNIVAVIDWEFAGSFPLSELITGGIEVLEYDDEASSEEICKWDSRILRLVEQIARERGWKSTEVDLLVRGGDRVFQAARVEMMPE